MTNNEEQTTEPTPSGRWVPDQKIRHYVYRVLQAGVPLTTAYGIISEQNAALWMGFAGAVLGVSLAAANS